MYFPPFQSFSQILRRMKITVKKTAYQLLFLVFYCNWGVITLFIYNFGKFTSFQEGKIPRKGEGNNNGDEKHWINSGKYCWSPLGYLSSSDRKYWTSTNRNTNTFLSSVESYPECKIEHNDRKTGTYGETMWIIGPSLSAQDKAKIDYLPKIS